MRIDSLGSAIAPGTVAAITLLRLGVSGFSAMAAAGTTVSPAPGWDGAAVWCWTMVTTVSSGAVSAGSGGAEGAAESVEGAAPAIGGGVELGAF